MELSQDCIEWDESNNADLRQFAKSPLESHHESCLQTTPVIPNFANRSSDTLNGIKRRLVEQSTPSPVNDTKSQLFRTKQAHSSIIRTEGPQKAEQEIDGIFSRLQEEQQQLISSDEASPQTETPVAPTPRQGNLAKKKMRIQTSNEIPSKATTSLAARFRRRRREMESLNQLPPKRLHQKQCAKQTDITTSPAPTRKEYEDEGDFEALLRQMTTPQSVSGRRQPLSTLSENEIEARRQQNSLMKRKQMLKAPDSEINPPINNQASGLVSITNTMTNQTQSSCLPKGLLASCKSGSEATIKNTQYNPKPFAQTMQQPTMRQTSTYGTAPVEVSRKEKEIGAENHSVCVGLPLSKAAGANHQHPRFSVISHLPSINDKSKRDTVSDTKRSQNIEDNDEFGDLTLSEDDFACLDSLLSVQSSEQALSKVRLPKILNQCLQTKSEAMGPSELKFEENSNPVEITRKTMSGNNPECDSVLVDTPKDEFGDFPDLDFDSIDQAIAQRLTQRAEIAETCSIDDHANDQSRFVLPPSIVANPRNAASSDEKLSFLTFSRYKVITVHDDISTYTKTLAVAAWRNEMLKEQEEAKKLFRNLKAKRADVRGAQYTNGLVDWNPPRYLQLASDGYLHLRGEWYHTKVIPGDIVHVCSLTGRFRTDVEALPLVLHSFPPEGSDIDDLVLVMHPDVIVTPTTVGEAVGCSRRAVLKTRLGSTGRPSQAALIGTMRHELFGLCMTRKNFSISAVKSNVQSLVRRHAESLLACAIAEVDAVNEVLSVFPKIQKFVNEYTAIGKEDTQGSTPFAVLRGHGAQPDLRFVANSVLAVEEQVVSAELGLKGNIDAVVHSTSMTINPKQQQLSQSLSQNFEIQDAIMCLELKTGHNQNPQHAHMAQLALYTLMLQARHGLSLKPRENRKIGQLGSLPLDLGAATGGILVYLNEQALHAINVSPFLNEIKSLVGQRNVVASELKQMSRPRGVVLSYDDGNKDDDQSPRLVHRITQC